MERRQKYKKQEDGCYQFLVVKLEQLISILGNKSCYKTRRDKVQLTVKPECVCISKSNIGSVVTGGGYLLFRIYSNEGSFGSGLLCWTGARFTPVYLICQGSHH